MANRRIGKRSKLDFISIVEQLEDRVLFDGVPDATFVLPEHLVDHALPESVDSQFVQEANQQTPVELLIVDGAVAGSDQLIRSILESAPDRSFEIRVLDSATDGVSQISEILSKSEIDFAAVHLVSHGDDGLIQLGSSTLDSAALSARAEEIAQWADALTEDADLLIYGCNLASSDAGESFVEKMASLTGADVAASDDLTGAEQLGGDWDLEFNTGQIDHEYVLRHSQWFGVLSTVSGTAYIDYNNDGSQDLAASASEVGIPGLAVTAYDSDGNVVDATTTAADGTYTINNVGNIPVRVEFTNAPTGFTESLLDPATADPDAVASVAFTAGVTNSVMNLALHRPSDISDSGDLQIVATCYFFGDGLTGNEPAIIRWDYANEGDYAGQVRGNAPDPATPYVVVATIGEVGSVTGLAYQNEIDTFFAGAHTKRHSGYGSGGSGAIYSITAGGTPVVFATLPNIADPHPTSTIGDATYRDDWDADLATYDLVGKSGLGDVDLSEDGTTVWAMNLFDNQLYEIPIGSTDAPLDLSQHSDSNIVAHDIITAILNEDANALGVNPLQNARPNGLAFHDGMVYIGIVNSAQYDASGVEGVLTNEDLEAYVFRFDPTSPTSAPEKVLEFGLDYQRQAIIDATFAPYTPGAWNPWLSTFPTTYIDGTAVPTADNSEVGYAMPILSDIEFDNDGSMILGFRDRFGDMGGYRQDRPDGSGTDYSVDSAGDILRADYVAGTDSWTIEGDLVYPALPSPDSADTSIEFYDADVYAETNGFGPTIHNEIAQGSLGLVPGYSEVFTSAMDPIDDVFFSGGLIFLDNSTGAESTSGGRTMGISLYTSGTAPSESFGKGNGIGDVEFLSAPGEMEIGDRIWLDTDRDGEQDAGEGNVPDGVTVELYDMTDPLNPVLVGTATTSNGQYLFNDSNVAYSDGGTAVGLRPFTDYEIRLVASDFQSGGLLQDYVATTANAVDDSIDSDAVNQGGIPIVALTTGATGESDHSFDMGLVQTDRGDLPTGYNVTAADDGATHMLDGVTFLGASADAEMDATNTANALGDDSKASDDEDGVTFLSPMVAGTNAEIQVVASVDGFLNAWIDFDGDGTLDVVDVVSVDGVPVAGGTTLNDLALTGGTHSIVVSVPVNAAGDTPARFRFTSDDPAGTLGPDGIWNNGEVEDYVLGAIGNYVWEDNGPGAATALNGVQDGTESGVAGVTVFLLDGTGSRIQDADGNDVSVTTDAAGFYQFSGLPAGDYQVEFVAPAGYLFTQANLGDDATDSDANQSTGITATTSIVAGETDDSIDAGLVRLDLGDLPDSYGTTFGSASGAASHVLDGVKFLGASVDSETDGQPSADATGDGSDEDGIEFTSPLTAGSSATLEVTASTAGFLNAWIDFDTSGTLDEVLVTHVDGVVLGTPTNIDDLALLAGTTELRFDVPATANGTMAARFRFTADAMGGTRSTNSLAPTGEVEDYVLGAIGNFVWEDNGAGGGTGYDGIQNGTEPGVGGVSVFLLDGSGNRIQDAAGNEISTTTDVNGFYQFAGLPPGGYQVEFVAPTGFSFTQQDVGNDALDSDANGSGVTGTTSIVAGEVNDSIDAGIVSFDYGDLPDGYGTTDGSAAGPARHVLDGVTYLGSSVDVDLDGQPTADATGDGADEDGVSFTSPVVAGTSATIEVTGAADGFLNAWIDFDSNGVLDEVTVTHVDGVALGTPTTISDLALTTGTTELRFDVPASATGNMAARFRYTSAAMGASRSPNNTAGSGEVEDYVLGSLGDRVFLDDNIDGLQTAGESGVSGVTVYLLDELENRLLDAAGNEISTTTDGNGDYEFAGLPAGNYRVEFEAPVGLSFTSQDVGGDDAIDSDADLATGVTSQVYAIAANTTEDSVDAGLVEQDRGDLPAGFNVSNADGGPSHTLDGATYLGASVDGELDAANTPDALGDDTGADDEDGVTFLDPMIAGTNARIEVVASADGFLNAWIDFNGNGTFDSGEQIALDRPLTTGANTITVAVPANATGVMAARFRFTSDDPFGALGPDGHWDNGEVEDYVLGAIGDYVWEDNGNGGGVPNDGIQNGTEPPVSGVTVFLLDGTGARIQDADGIDVSTTTDVNGAYEFAGLPAGNYRVQFVAPVGFEFTQANIGNDATDSDADQTTGVTATTTLTPGEVNNTVDAGLVEYDYGDLTDGYGTTNASGLGAAKHVVDDVTFLGAGVDAEADGAPTAAADGDDNDGSDDEDGVTFLSPLMPGVSAEIEVNASTAGFLNGWIDFDSDGVLDEVVVTAVNGVPLGTPANLADIALNSGANTITFDVPANADGNMAARFRFTSDQMGAMRSPNGDWSNGEVEDYVLGSLGDYVWVDNGDGGGGAKDGIQNGTESGVGGVLVTLLDASENPVTDADGNSVTTTTAADGSYRFVGLPAGDYKVHFGQPGIVLTDADQGGDDALDSDADFTTGITGQTYTISANTTETSVDAGILEVDFGDLPDGYGTTGGVDGARHAIETGVYLGSGVDNEIDGQPNASATGDDLDDTDDEDGVLFVTPLVPGRPATIEVSPNVDGYLNAWIDFDSDGTLDEVLVTHVDGVLLGTPVNIDDLNLTAGSHDLTFDVPATATGTMAARFRFSQDAMGSLRSTTGLWRNGEVEDYVLGAIGDYVWIDNGLGGGTGNDGQQNGTEPALAGVTVRLMDSAGNPIVDADGVAITTVTAADGSYEFPGLPDGDYRVQFDLPTGFQFTDTDLGDDSTDSDANESTGLTDQTYTITAGVTNATVDAGLLEQDFGDLPDSYSTLTGSGGAVHGIDGNTYLGSSVDAELDGQPSGTATGDDANTDDEDGVTFLDPMVAGTDARIEVVANSDGFLNAWVDFNGNGTFDAGEQIATDYPLTAGTNVITVSVPATATGVMGARFRFTSDNTGASLGPDGAWDNGEVEDYILGAIGDYAWEDNGAGGGVAFDGVQDGGEPAVSGATVFLLDGSGNRIQDANGNEISTTTDASGAYEFAGLPSGDYSVEFVAPGGYTFTAANVADDATDSDANELTGVTASTNLLPGEVDDTLDAGFVRLDYGDLPDGYGTTNGSTDGSARHVVDGVTYLGGGVDSETDGQPTADATGDGTDEDGVVFSGPLTAGASATINVTTSAVGFLNAWIDFDSDGVLDEVLITHVDGAALGTPVNIDDLALPGGTTELRFDVPANATGNMAARFRYTATAMGAGRSPNGTELSGEVEDYVLGSIGDQVFLDSNNDGLQTGEAGFSTVTVFLLDATGSRIQDAAGVDISTVTDVNGDYEFAGLPAGDYRVEFVAPVGYYIAKTNQGADDAIDSDADEATGITTQTYTIAANTTEDSVDAGLTNRDRGDLRSGFNVSIADGGPSHTLDASTYLGASIDGEADAANTADASGDEADEDGVTFLDPLVAGTNARVEVVANSDGFLNAWVDFNSNGTFDSGEQIVSDEPLTAGSNIITVAVPATATGAMGVRFRFTSDDPAGALGPDGHWDNGEVEDYMLGAIGDYVWEDNGILGGVPLDGEQDASEPPVAGVTVYLLDGSGNRIQDADGNDISTTTDASGRYEFAGLPAGDYQIEFAPGPEYQFTRQDAGSDDTIDSDADVTSGVTDTVSLTPGEVNETIDAGVARFDYGDLDDSYGTTDGAANPGAVHLLDGATYLGATVDSEQDGQPAVDATGDGTDEDGVVFTSPLTAGSNASFEITASVDGILNAWIDFDSDGVLDEIMITHEDGNPLPFPFPLSDWPIVAGTTEIRFNVPANATGNMAARFRFTDDLMGTTRSPNGIAIDEFGVPLAGEVEDYVLGSIGDRVFSDSNSDGLQTGEPGVENVTVYLLDGTGARIQDADGVDISTVTDANGDYEFAGLPAGDYRVEFVAPTGLLFTTANQGADDANDSDADEVTGITSQTYTIAANTTIDTVDAGLVLLDRGDLPTGFNVTSADGGPAHKLDGVTFLGASVDGEVDATNTADASGDGDDEDGVIFLNPLAAGTDAQIEVTASVDGFLNAWIDFNGNNSFDSGEQIAVDEPLVAGTNTLTISVPASATGVMAARFRFTSDSSAGALGPDGEWDNGEVEDYILGSIGDYTFSDNNLDGLQDGGDTALAGVVVNLLDGSGNPILDANGNQVTTTSDASGAYEFAGLPAGTYTVEFIEPAGLDVATANVGANDAIDSDGAISDPVFIGAGETNTTLDAGFVPEPTFTYDYGDLPDSYGTLDADGGPNHLIDGVTFLGSGVDNEADGQSNANATGDGSDEDGVEFLDPLVAGTDARIEVEASVDGYLNAWIDFNGDGMFGAGEQIATDMFLTGGLNEFTISVPPTATGLIGARFRFTADDPAGTLGTGGAATTGEVEDYLLGSIGNFVFTDVNGDGLQDAGDTPLSGVVVNLLDGAGNPVLDANSNAITTTTDAAGWYEFAGLPPGSYSVEFIEPVGLDATTANVGADDSIDSDGPVTTPVSLGAGESNTTLDAGFVTEPILTYDYGDLPDTYSTLDASGGANHQIDGVTFLGSTVDDEADGQPTADASGDIGDEDGVVFATPLVAGTDATIEVTASVDGFLNAWIDFNGNGTFEAAEQIAADFAVTAGTNTINVSVPATATGIMGARFRFTSDDPAGALGADGQWDNGEVEDYILGSIGDLTFNDNNADGLQNAGDTPLAGVVVNLLDGSGNPVLDANGNAISTTTDASGLYEFAGLSAGSYSVEFVTPVGLDITTSNVGADDMADSDGEITAPVAIGAGESNTTLDAGFVPEPAITYDYGDLPDSYETLDANNGANHLIDGVTFLGAGVDNEADGQPSVGANGDGSDENGVVFVTPLVAGADATIEVTASVDGFLNAWIDFNGDGTFDAAEQIAIDEMLTSGVNTLTVSVPATATGIMGARFRFTADDPAGTLGSGGAAASGEVEDYILGSIGDYTFNDVNGNGLQDGGDTPLAGVIVNLLDGSGNPVLDANGNAITTTTDASGAYEFAGLPPESYSVEFVEPTGLDFTSSNVGADDTIDSDGATTSVVIIGAGVSNTTLDAGFVPELYDYGDLPDSYSTLDASGGANHKIDGVTFLGSSVDNEVEGQPSANANGDGLDEDGVTFVNALVAETDADIEVVASVDGFLNAWIDFNSNGTFDAGERIATDLPVTAGTNTITVSVPATATGIMGARFRFTSDDPNGSLGPDGQWDNGEVEDYILGSIGDYTFNDNNEDGLQDAGDTPLSGVVVALLDGAGNPMLDANGNAITTTTDFNGLYEFAGLPAERYSVQFTELAGLDITTSNVGADDSIDSDGLVTAPVTIVAGETNTTLDAGFVTEPPPVYDYGDLPDSYVTLDSSIGANHLIDGVTFLGSSVDDELDGQPTADASGDGDDEDGVVFATPLVAGTDATIEITASVDGFLNAWIDFNGNGTFEGGEQIATDQALTAGLNTLTVSVPANATGVMGARFRFTADHQGGGLSYDDYVDSGEVEDYILGMIGNYTFTDVNADGLQDAGDTALAGVVVNLLDGSGNSILDANGNAISTVTDAAGMYEFAGLPAQSYSVEFVEPTGLDFTTTDVGGDESIDSDGAITAPIALGAGGINRTLDAGFVPQPNPDYDYGDLPDSYETLDASNGARHQLDGVTFLGSSVDHEADGQPSSGATGDVGDEDGVVFVTPLVAGTDATVEVTASVAGYLNAWIDFNGNGTFEGGEQIATDQALTAGVNTLTVSVPANATGVMGARFRFTADDPAGSLGSGGTASTGEVEDYILGMIGNYTFTDVNADGLQDAGDTPLAGVVVNLLDGSGNPILDANGNAISTVTDAVGMYEFAGLPAQSYSVEFVEPVGLDFTTTDVGGDESIDSDGAITAPITLGAGGINRTLDAGFVPEPAITYDYGDLPDSYETLDANNGANHLIDGVTFLGAGVDNESDGQPSSAATGDVGDEDGVVFVTPLVAGTDATIEVTASVAGYLNAWIDFNGNGTFEGGEQIATDQALTAGVNTLTVSVPTNATGVMGARFRFTADDPAGSLGSGGTASSGEVEDYILGMIGNYTFTDVNADGLQDAGDTALAGVVVNLLDGSGNPILDANGNAISTVTDAAGMYEFAGLPAQSYSVEFVEPTGLDFTTTDVGGDESIDSDGAITAPIALGAGGINRTLDAGFVPQPNPDYDYGDLPDSYETLDANNGARHQLDGVTFLGSSVDNETDGQPSSAATGDVGDEDGVVFVTPLVAGTDATIEVTASVAGYLNAWIDFNGNGTFDSGEQIASDQLLSAGVNTLTVGVPTNATGVMGARFRFTADDPAGSLGSGGTASTGEVEDYILGMIGNYTFTDVNADGLQDAGDTALAGVVVNLLDGSGNPILDANGNAISTVTDAAGMYEFAGLPAQSYSVEFVEPTGLDFTTTDVGGDESIDSDGAITAPITLGAGGINRTLDAGFVPEPAITYDYGDLPDGYGTLDANNGANHQIDGTTYLGSTVDNEADGQPTFDATGDGADEDGVVFTSPLVAGFTASVEITTSAAGFLNAWIDFDSDGVLDEVLVAHVDGTALSTPTNIDDLALAAGTTELQFDVPANATGTMAARFRYTAEAMGAARSPVGSAPTGEVEDYVLGAIGDKVFADANGDGVYNSGEATVPGVRVYLLNSLGRRMIDAENRQIFTTTDAVGCYEFAGLPPGTYHVEFQPPPGTFLSPPNQGGDDDVDSDPDPDVGVQPQIQSQTPPITVLPGVYDDSVDAGLTTRDFGDLPTGYHVAQNINGASHTLDGSTYLGATVDAEADGVNSAGAISDDNDGTDDEDGVVFLTPLTAGSTATIEVTASTVGYLNAWIDFNGDTTFDAADQIATDLLLQLGVNTITVNVPADATGVMGARFRFTSDDTAGAIGPNGHWGNGEVEDYVLNAIGDYVWQDNGDSVQSGGDVRITGIGLYLLDENGVRIQDAAGNYIYTVTDSNGRYEFAGLPDGDYRIEIGSSPYSIVDQNVGGDDASDSDLDPITGISDVVSVSGGELNDTLDVGLGLFDFGDLPSLYGETTLEDDGARHIFDSLVRLGSAVGVETTGTHSDDALFDDNDFGTDDEDGVLFLSPLVPGTAANIQVTGAGFLNAWIDFNSDGVLDEVTVTAIDGVPLATPSSISDLSIGGTHVLTIEVPADATGTMAARFRLSADAMGTARSTSGLGGRGEVEDYVLGAIGDRVFFDTGAGTTGNGLQDAGETGAPGVNVYLLDAAGNRLTDANGNDVVTVTDASGLYEFPGLPEGDYRVEFELPAGHTFTIANVGSDLAVDSNANRTTGITDAVYSIAPGETNPNVDAGLLPLASLGDRVWFDVDADGVQDADEAGLNGIDIQIEVDIDGDGTSDYTETTTTSGDGEYLFPALPPGTVTVTMVNPPAGYRGTFSADGGATDIFDGTLDPNQDRRDVDFGLTGISSLAGTVHEDGVDDADEPFFIDGVQDTGEPGIPNVTITLQGVTDSGIPFTKTTTTDSAGDYRFLDLPPGTYTIIETQPTSSPLTASSPNYVDGLDTIGSLGGAAASNSLIADQHSAILLGVDEHGTDYDFSEIPEARTDGYVFVDANDNGVFDPGERGIPEVPVTLSGVDVFGTPVLRTTTTDANGFYEFTSLYAGTYDLNEIQPTQFEDGQEQNGSVPVIVSNDNFGGLSLIWGDNTFSYNFGELDNSTTSGNPPVFRTFPPITRSSRIDPGLPGPGPIYPGIPIFSNGGVLSLDSGRPVTGGYSIENQLLDACCCEIVVDPCSVCEEPVVVDACGQELVRPTTPVEYVAPPTPIGLGEAVGEVEVPQAIEILEAESEAELEEVVELEEFVEEETETIELSADANSETDSPAARIDEAAPTVVPNLPTFLQRFTGWMRSSSD
ncbi:SdrD B-like domain-containing protein [Mariniblastus fucicola]|uniref:Serine-aspartate repeat-containing protein D n=1 Tax=Mariniblastus fucicola TaxID=980251 RepID=A0A5B9PD68_9BACT|nr:SdrD B-like domain-containing protein [Mariniblastus fucicola]QEG24328.1 Serine-aspartate repeat-containing protein D precursor [Mariniblastus fucicola]